jgi:hypothetical protein
LPAFTCLLKSTFHQPTSVSAPKNLKEEKKEKSQTHISQMMHVREMTEYIKINDREFLLGFLTRPVNKTISKEDKKRRQV